MQGLQSCGLKLLVQAQVCCRFAVWRHLGSKVNRRSAVPLLGIMAHVISALWHMCSQLNSSCHTAAPIKAAPSES